MVAVSGVMTVLIVGVGLAFAAGQMGGGGPDDGAREVSISAGAGAGGTDGSTGGSGGSYSSGGGPDTPSTTFPPSGPSRTAPVRPTDSTEEAGPASEVGPTSSQPSDVDPPPPTSPPPSSEPPTSRPPSSEPPAVDTVKLAPFEGASYAPTGPRGMAVAVRATSERGLPLRLSAAPAPGGEQTGCGVDERTMAVYFTCYGTCLVTVWTEARVGVGGAKPVTASMKVTGGVTSWAWSTPLPATARGGATVTGTLTRSGYAGGRVSDVTASGDGCETATVEGGPADPSPQIVVALASAGVCTVAVSTVADQCGGNPGTVQPVTVKVTG